MKKVRSLWARLCAWTLAALGMGAAASSCDKIDISDIFGGGGMMCMYGTPMAEYQIKGQVVDKDTGAGIKGIKVQPARYSFDPEYGAVLTDASGDFILSGNIFPTDTLQVNVMDVDGSDNGLYKDDTVLVKLKQTEKGKGTWDEGKYEADGVGIKMKQTSAK